MNLTINHGLNYFNPLKKTDHLLIFGENYMIRCDRPKVLEIALRMLTENFIEKFTTIPSVIEGKASEIRQILSSSPVYYSVPKVSKTSVLIDCIYYMEIAPPSDFQAISRLAVEEPANDWTLSASPPPLKPISVVKVKLPSEYLLNFQISFPLLCSEPIISVLPDRKYTLLNKQMYLDFKQVFYSDLTTKTCDQITKEQEGLKRELSLGRYSPNFTQRDLFGDLFVEFR